MKKLPLSFYLREDVIAIAKELLGKVLVTNWDGELTSGRIVETEAYAGELDQASHASKGRTERTEVMYGSGGQVYVYLCYGIHQMFNIVTSKEGEPHAILVRAIEPMEGKEIMLERTGKKKWDDTITSGPGRVGKALGFHTSQCGLSLVSDELYIADDGYKVNEAEIVSSPRIGVDYAGEHAEWHYRFYLKESNYVSGKKGKPLKSKTKK
ncbi:MAG: DNA-3-methyladenine glycosylase [Chitinophagaceae bacterium]|nr:MAG: DNA-3-methyladenine glycosylase [Chitinophagaceae bacterium]